MTRESSPIVEFITARLDEAEAKYREAAHMDDPKLQHYYLHECGDYNERYIVSEALQWLREIESKRRILDETVSVLDSMEAQIDGEWGTGSGPLEESDKLLRLLALPYEGHSDYTSAVGPAST